MQLCRHSMVCGRVSSQSVLGGAGSSQCNCNTKCYLQVFAVFSVCSLQGC